MAAPPNPKKVAAIVTEFRRWSHADVIVSKILEGYEHDGKSGPNLKLVSLYCDQFPDKELSRALAKKHGFAICDSIEKALTLGGKALAVDGVLSIGEHGKYPENAKGQVLYPRRRFFEEIATVFAKTKKAVPVFNDKHLAAAWKDAKWMYDRANELAVPFLAGSSLPLTWRRPPLTLSIGCDLVEAVQIAYGGIEAYGFHALEGLQCLAERRKGGETGVKAVQCLQGKAIWDALDKGKFSKTLLEAAMAVVPAHVKGNYREIVGKNAEASLMLVEYKDGFQGAVAILNGWAQDGNGGGFAFAGKLKSSSKPVATQFYLQDSDPFAHFSCLLKAIDYLMRTYHTPYPIERTLLTTGILDAIMTSRAEKNKRIETPHLAIKYKPSKWPFATGPLPKPIKR
jgi:hypothetical protein